MIRYGKIEKDEFDEKQLKELNSIQNILKFPLDKIFTKDGNVKFIYNT